VKIRQFLMFHRKVFIAVAVILILISTAVYQSIHANDDGIPTTKVYWMMDTLPLDRLSTWILPHNNGYLSVTNSGTLVCELNAGMSLSFYYPANDPNLKFHACFAKDEQYQILCTEQSEQGCMYSLRTVSADGERIKDIDLFTSDAAFVDCRLHEDILAMITETHFYIFSVSDAAHLLYEQAYAGTSPQVCITKDTVLFSTSADEESTLYEYSIPTDSSNRAVLSYAPLYAMSAAPSGTDSKYLIGCGNDLLGMDAQFSINERFLDLRESWTRSTDDSTIVQTLSQDNISAIYTDGTVIYITDTRGTVFKFDVFWGDAISNNP